MSKDSNVIVMNTKEKEDVQPLPSEWKSAQDLGEVTLYQMLMSPPCCKLRTIFSYYQIKYKVIAGKKPDSEYKKVPVVVIHNRQINDSFVVVKNLARILDGSDLTKELLDVEEMTTFGLMVALEADVGGSCVALNKCGPKMGCFYCFLLGMCGCILCCIVPGAIRKQNPEMQSLEYYQTAYIRAIGSKQYFHGDQPGIVDVSLCGVLSPFIHAGTMNSVQKFLGSSGPLFDWYNRMKPRIPNVF